MPSTRGNMAYTPDVITYSSAIGKKSLHNVIIIAVLHDLGLKTAEVFNTHVIAPNREFGDKACKSARALYGIKSAGALFRASLAQYVKELKYKSCDDNAKLQKNA